MAKREYDLDLGDVKSAQGYEQNARAYRVHWKQRCWAIALVHEESATLSILSDHGNWAHCWGWRSLPKEQTFHAFLASCEAGYIAAKLVPHDKREVVCPDATQEAIKAKICECRRVGDIDRREARAAWDALAEWNIEAWIAGSEEEPYDLCDVLPEPLGEYAATRETTDVRAFRSIWRELRKLIAAGMPE